MNPMLNLKSLLLALALGLAFLVPQPAVYAADEGKEDEVDEWSNKQKEEAEGVLDRIRKLMDSVAGRLAEYDVGDKTQEEQRKIVEQIDEVIRKAQQMQQSQCNSSQQEKEQKEKERQEREQQRQKKKSKGDLERERQEEQKRQMAKPEDDKDSGDKNQEKKVVEKREKETGGALPENVVRPGEDWGHLPERLRDDAMDARSRDFPERYRELIERFYKRLAD